MDFLIEVLNAVVQKSVKSNAKDSYIKEDGLTIHSVDDDLLDKYLTYAKLICLAKGMDKYISKNNNNILRLAALQKIENSKIIMLFRDPVSHASSLLKLDKRFSKEQTEDPFSLDYFNYLGHHEFGLNHKPFLLTTDFANQRQKFSKENLNYWLAIWLNYYSYLLNNNKDNYLFISFEDLINTPDTVYDFIADNLKVKSKFALSKKHNPSTYPILDCDVDLLKKCLTVYEQLSELKKY